MRSVKVILHRKIGSARLCVCGSGMIYIDGWHCKRRIRLKEPKHIWKELDNENKKLVVTLPSK